MEKIAAKGVDRADTSELQLLERAVEPIAFLARRLRPGLFDLAAQAKLHFAGRFLGEGDRDDAIERSGAGADQADDPADEGGGLAGPSRRLDKEGRAELGHGSDGVLRRPRDRSWQRSQGQKRLQVSLRLPRRPALFVAGRKRRGNRRDRIAPCPGTPEEMGRRRRRQSPQQLERPQRAHCHREGPRARRSRRPTCRNKAGPR